MEINKLKGQKGEDFAEAFLKNKGFEVIQRNYHSRYGEIDIICADDKYIVFVEVKTRKRSDLVYPMEAVGKSKRMKIIKTAFVYFINHLSQKQPRFDICEVIASKSGTFFINHLENAFDLEEYDAFF